jgi:PhoH-like ATPase
VVLDTSALIADPECLFSFPDADAVIPLVVIEELDQHKTRLDDVGRAARAVIRTIEDLRVGNGGDIRHAGAVPGGGTLRIETNGLHLDRLAATGLDVAKADNRILAAALGQAEHGPVRVVSNDAALRIKAAQLGLDAAEHHRLRGRLRARPSAGLDHDRGEPAN